MCRLHQGLKNCSSIFAICIWSTVKGITGLVIFQDDVLIYELTNEEYQKRILAVKSRLREKIFTINEKYPINQSQALENVEKIKNATPKSNIEQLESFVGLANFYGRMIPDFATKILLLNENWKDDFRWEKRRTASFRKHKK